MIKVSESAKSKINSLMQEDGSSIEESYVRVGVTSGGCSGLSYNLEFDKDQKPEDKLFEDNGVRILVDKKSFLYLVGMTLEYSGGLNGKGFIFNNPNATRTCGCGESFAI
ncbi:iron-sulfur cluster assembly accessory protein [Chishuiella sp.]|uniref:HesB/IscA family protein n=1 Tax=Chishuiella sp. TaxID=1969467 RepID=UPI0028AAB5CD|nr:iron-sulfur cluster assembly accessory protein [Chishuiella sp.]